MRYVFSAVLLFSLVALTVGCSGGNPGPKPKHDPNWKDTSNPSNIVVPDSLKKGPAPAAPAPTGQK